MAGVAEVPFGFVNYSGTVLGIPSFRIRLEFYFCFSFWQG
jgi:hypothetical protein